MRRREFMALLTSVAFARPQVARAQQTVIPVVGYLGQGSSESDDAERDNRVSVGDESN